MQQGHHNIARRNMANSFLLMELEQEDQTNWLVVEPAELNDEYFEQGQFNLDNC